MACCSHLQRNPGCTCKVQMEIPLAAGGPALQWLLQQRAVAALPLCAPEHREQAERDEDAAEAVVSIPGSQSRLCRGCPQGVPPWGCCLGAGLPPHAATWDSQDTRPQHEGPSSFTTCRRLSICMQGTFIHRFRALCRVCLKDLLALTCGSASFWIPTSFLHVMQKLGEIGWWCKSCAFRC